MKRIRFGVWFILVAAILACQTTDLFSSYLESPAETPTRTRAAIRASDTPRATLTAAPVAVIATPTPVEITGTLNNNANIRASASTSAPIAARASKGDQLKLIARTAANDWYLVRLPNNPNAYGWVSAPLVQADGAERLPVYQPGAPLPYPRP